ncbi:MAG: hypothetical protein EKK43_14470 [Methylobacterium sp.]|uniref:hypothetical protein n=1 Tax=Methylobacterium sp. TaxID=409 RepID=UPI000FAD8EDE|nr:hypothetical protein [Methylobacterium sp.]RUP13899.1 MAG: hypothetical protein EKK43_14470 [Methylobacterium sp.]
MAQQDERQTRAELRRMLDPDFETYEEVDVRHALFRKRRLRVDLLAIPRDPLLSDLALAFETKGERDWLIPTYAEALKQASDYVLARVEPKLAEHAGKPVMATFIYPAPRKVMEPNPRRVEADRKIFFLSGMAHMAGYHRVGTAQMENLKRGQALVLSVNEEIWNSQRGWRTNARNVLAGKRQVGSQRFPILEEIQTLDGTR